MKLSNNKIPLHILTVKLKQIFNLLKDYIAAQLNYFDPVIIKNSKYKNKSSSQLNSLYLFPFLITVSTALYGNFVLVYLAENENLDFKFKLFHQNPNSLTHQVVPPSMWPQMDVVYAIVVLTTTANYITFVRRPLYTGGKYEVLAKKSLNASKWIPVLSISGQCKNPFLCIHFLVLF